jgi:eukaryotic-like serine/threonine-protein kinase
VTAVAQRLTRALEGRYRIERELGAGGMATVYLAEDLKHDRKVAIKVLKPELAAVLGADRFVVEIKTTAAMSHPHILPLFDSGTADGFLFYVMPYIQGETIREKLNRETQFGVDDAVRIAREVADALDYAHRNGIIHRDIKPENILLHDGRAMVMDFGIALAVSAAAGGRMTETGLSLGTPHYMSPEQATAEKEISARSDQYSLASVLYEMLAGQPPHVGGAAQQVIMRIITEPSRAVSEFRKNVPANVTAALARALEKLPADRFDSARAFADALQNEAFTVARHASIAAATGWKGRAVVSLVVVSVTLAAALAWQLTRPQPDAPPMRYDLTTGAPDGATISDVVISPDGSMLAFIGPANTTSALFLRRLSVDMEFQKVAGSDGAVASPEFSPDNQWLAFRRGNEMVKVPVAGGVTQLLARIESAIGNFPTWSGDDQVIYSGGPGGLVRVASNGGGTADTIPGTRGADRYSFALPDGSGVLFSRASGIYVIRTGADSATQLLTRGAHPVYVGTGHLLYLTGDGELFAVPFDLKHHAVSGTPVRVLERVATGISRRGFSVSSGGTLVYQDGASTLAATVGQPTLLIIGDFSGKADTLRLPRGRRLQPRFSPDGLTLAFEWFLRGGGAQTDLATFDLVRGTTTRLTSLGDNDDPQWSPDGRQIAFTKGLGANGEDLFVKPSDNSVPERLLLTGPGSQNPTQWTTPDTILVQSNAEGQADLLTYSVKESKATAYVQGPWIEQDLQVSSHGKLAAFSSNETGQFEIWVRDFPTPSGKWQISATGGRMPRWSRDGSELYYWHIGSAIDSLYRVRIDRTPGVRVNTPQLVLTRDIVVSEGWDLHPDGKRFIVVESDLPRMESTTAAARAHYVIVPNWFTELKAKTAAARK